MFPFSLARLRPLLSLLGAVLLATALPATTPAPVRAHAELVESTPAANASLVEPPAELRLRFTEPIDADLVFVDLLDAAQRRLAGVGPIAVGDGGDSARVALPLLGAGVYTVTYQVLSSVDGHATTGSFAFVIDPAGTEAPPPVPPAASSPSVDGWTIAGRWLGLGGMIVALGGLVLWWRSRPVLGGGRPGRPPWFVVALAAGIAFIGIAVYLTLAARPIAEALPDRSTGFPLDFAAPFGWTPFAIAMRVAFGASLLAGIVACAAWFAGTRRSEAPVALAVVAVLGIGLGGMSMAAHAAAAGGPAFAVVDWVHVAAVATWLGGLPTVPVLARRLSGTASAGDTARRILRRHGPIALVAAPVVALTGIANSPLVLGRARDLVGSEYGNLLLAKAVLLSVAVGIGAINYLVLRGRGRAGVALLVGAELAVAAVAVSVAATMVTIQPAAGRQPVPVTAQVNPAHLFGTAGPSDVHATINLPMPGVQTYQVTVTDAETGAPRDDLQRVFLHLSPPPGSELAVERVDLAEHGERPGLFTTSGAYLSLEGSWTVEVVVRRSGALDEATAFTVPVSQPSPPQLVPQPDTGIGVPAPIGLLWSVLPRGAGAWLPAGTALAGLVVASLIARRRRSTAIDAARVVFLGLLVVGVLGAGSRTLIAVANAPGADELTDHRPPAELVTSMEDGAAIYLANCAACHGQAGDGSGPIRTLPPAGALPVAVARMTSAELSYRIANGYAGTAMPPFAAALTEAERWNLVAYLEDRWR